MADLIAIVSVLSSATVAVSVPFINASLERRRLHWQGMTARTDELRSVLDSALLRMSEARAALGEGLAALNELEFPVDPTAGADTLSQRLTQRHADATEALDAMRSERSRIAVRLGAAHEIVGAYDEALQALQDVARVVANPKAASPEDPGGVAPVYTQEDIGRARLVVLASVPEIEAKFADCAMSLIGIAAA